ncbi:hypothetical protein [Rhodanobacter sp. 115]|uniref:hypothetical protein n=1 Tax=Rhodanobacter sp. FW021-MT20 TaxID=1162282 RepID=UPI001ED8F74F|nr:hypothetical protein [Rhodanobacter sp. 115]
MEWYAAAPDRWYQSGKKDLGAAAEWILNVIEGDFADQQSNAQVITGTVISLIPGVDQLCDVRDLVANCKKIHEDVSNTWAWVALPLTLIGLFPELGSLAKGGGKILFAYGRKSVFKVGEKALESGLWKASEHFVEAGIGKLDQYLKMPMVRKTLKALRIHRPYHFLSEKVSSLAGHVSLSALLAAFDKVLRVLRSLVEKIQHWGSEALATRAGSMLQVVIDIRNKANQALKKVLAPVTQWLEQLARRLEVQGDMNYRAIVNSTNPHGFTRVEATAEEAHFAKAKPDWVDETPKLKYSPREDCPPIPAGWPDISGHAKSDVTRNAFDTFHDVEPVVIPPGEKIYRVLDPGSYDDRICWMREAEFQALKSKSQWRRRFAVWGSWNRNGEYVTYVVPPGEGLKAWEGPAASQSKKGAAYVLEGGGIQLVLDPADLKATSIGKRQSTNWGYSEFPGESDAKLGLPTLTNNLSSMQKKK